MSTRSPRARTPASGRLANFTRSVEAELGTAAVTRRTERCATRVLLTLLASLALTLAAATATASTTLSLVGQGQALQLG